MPAFSPATTLEDLRRAMSLFCSEREWSRFHTPRNLLLALVGEVGEVAELFQWRGDAGAAASLPDWSAQDRTHLGEELSDVLLYLVRLSDVCGVDLPAAALRKMQRNAAKYPIEASRGRSVKYTQLAEEAAAASSTAAAVAAAATLDAAAPAAAADADAATGGAAEAAPPVSPPRRPGAAQLLAAPPHGGGNDAASAAAGLQAALPLLWMLSGAALAAGALVLLRGAGAARRA